MAFETPRADLRRAERWALWGLPLSGGGWAWSQVTNWNDGDQVVWFALEEGMVNLLRFTRREDGAKIDRIIVTNDPGFVPVDVSIVPGPGPSLP